MRSIELFNKLDLLQSEIRTKYYKEIDRVQSELPITLKDEKNDDSSDCLIVDIVDEINGGIYSVYVTKINSIGEFDGEDLNDENIDNYGITDIANEYNKIELIQILEKL